MQEKGTFTCSTSCLPPEARARKSEVRHRSWILHCLADFRTVAEKLLLSDDPQDYGFLKHSRTQIDGVDDSSEWQMLKVSSGESMKGA